MLTVECRLQHDDPRETRILPPLARLPTGNQSRENSLPAAPFGGHHAPHESSAHESLMVSPAGIAAIASGSCSVIALLAKGIRWAVGQIIGALDGIKEAVDGVKGEVAELRSDLDKIAGTTAANSKELTDHEGRLRELEGTRVIETTPARRTRKGR